MTYMGLNVDPVPSYMGEPITVEVSEKKAEEIALALYESLSPPNGKKDFRVGLACARISILEGEIQELKIINRQEG